MLESDCAELGPVCEEEEGDSHGCGSAAGPDLGAHADAPQKRRRLSCGSGKPPALVPCPATSDAMGGPQSLSETFDWPARFLQRLREKPFGIDSEDALVQSFRRGQQILTDYSGLGTPEFALSEICNELQRNCWQLGHGCNCARASDIAQHCRAMLRFHTGSVAPSCILGNQLDRMSKAAHDQVLQLQAKIYRQFKEAVNRGIAPKQKLQESYGRRFIHEAPPFPILFTLS